MVNTSVTLTFKVPARIYATVAKKNNRSAWLRNAVTEKLAREPKEEQLMPKTPLAVKLLAARKAYAQSGRPFLSLDEVMDEVAKRRGER